MSIRTIATQHTLSFLSEVLPKPPCRILEVGCGHGDLALELQKLGYDVLAIDNADETVQIAREKGVNAKCYDIRHIKDTTFDCVLFTRSLHHAFPISQSLDNAKMLLNQNGLLIAEEFSLEQMDLPTAMWFYGLDSFVKRKAIDLSTNLLDVWNKEHYEEPPIYLGNEMLGEISSRFDVINISHSPYLYRSFIADLEKVSNNKLALESIFIWEKNQIHQKLIRPLGLRIVARKSS